MSLVVYLNGSHFIGSLFLKTILFHFEKHKYEPEATKKIKISVSQMNSSQKKKKKKDKWTLKEGMGRVEKKNRVLWKGNKRNNLKRRPKDEKAN